MGSWYDIFPELNWISDKTLQDKVIAIYDEAMSIAGFQRYDEFLALPFSMKFPQFDLTLCEHIRMVTQLCDSSYKTMLQLLPDHYSLNYDYLIAAGLIHDVGKVFAFDKDSEGHYVFSRHEILLRHAFSGCGLAMKHGMPEEICHIVAYHADEGVGKFRSPEAVILNKCDYLTFDIMKAFYGMKQEH